MTSSQVFPTVDEYLSFNSSYANEKSTISFSCLQKLSGFIIMSYNSEYLLKFNFS